jgi:Tfp pilus assembly protein PilF
MKRLAQGFGLLALLVLFGCASSSAPPQDQLLAGLDPKDPLAPVSLLQEGASLLRDGRVEDALKRFQAAAQLQPANPVVHNFIGLAFLAKNQPAKALEAFTRALSLAPTFTDARNNRGVAYQALGQLAQAESEFLAALQDLTYANRAGVFFNLGTVYFSQGRLEAAEENLAKAASSAGPVEAFVLLGQVQERLGKTAAAMETYRKGMAKAPERADLPLRLGVLLLNQGKKEEAHELFRKVVELAPDSREAAQAQVYLSH